MVDRKQQGRETAGRQQGPAEEPGGKLPQPGREPTLRVSPDLSAREVRGGHRPGDRYVRVVRPHAREFKRKAPGHLVATERVLRPKGMLGSALGFTRRLLFGSRLRSEMEVEERASKIKGLAIFASDNISSSAYATEEIMRSLVLAGTGVLFLSMPISVAIVVVLAIVVTSYQQVIRAYPNGGGSYIVAHDNLGPLAGLTAAAALLTDYILTVAVSTSAGVAAITSAFPELFAQRVLISGIVVTIMAILNLRGIRESGTVFAAPTYLYVFAILGVIGLGLFRAVTGALPAYQAPAGWLHTYGVQPLGLLLILRAFASGSVALSGVEAVSNGVPAFKPPEIRNAQIVLIAMGTLFGIIFLGIGFLSGRFGIIPDPEEVETVTAQITRTLVGTGWYFYLVQFSTAVVLVLAANTAFNGFPRLASIVARDGYLPRQFQFRGDRLAFSVGIVVLAVIAIILIIVYQGSVTGLIPLYTIGVFLAFTLNQAGMVRRWFGLRISERGWLYRAAINGLGCAATGVVTIVVAISKFALGAWIVLLLIPLLIAMMSGIKRHYRRIEDELTLERPNVPLAKFRQPIVIVLVSKLDLSSLNALAYAHSLSPDVRAVHVTDDPEEAEAMRLRWERWGGDVPLVIVESPYRALIQPLLAYIDAVDNRDPTEPITIVLPEIVPRHLWEYVLHSQTALRLKMRLFLRPNTVVVNVPYHVGH